MLRRLFLPLFVASAIAGCDRTDNLRPPIVSSALDSKVFDDLVAKHRNLSYEQLAAEVPPREYSALSFDVSQAKYYAEVVKQLQLTESEQMMLARNGFVAIDHDQQYSFGSLYYGIYTRDLPVLITTDSILHAMHHSYDAVLLEIEQTYLSAALNRILALCHAEVARLSATNRDELLADNYRDVDLYLAVARNLLQGAGAPAGESPRAEDDVWNGQLLIATELNQDAAAIELLRLVQSLELQNPENGDVLTQIYGGTRPIDYSQFAPRGHYTKHIELMRYFRTMMWISRADTGFIVLPYDPKIGITCDSQRELRNAVLLTQVLESSGAAPTLAQMDDIINFMVGHSDNLGAFKMGQRLRDHKVASLADLANAETVERLQSSINSDDLARQQLRSQLIFSDPYSSQEVLPPALFQLFGQRYALDSFLLSKVVFDSIVFEGKKQERWMPQGLDVVCALGNDETIPLLAEDLVEFKYGANLKAAQQFVERHSPQFWRESLYNIWLDALRTLDDDHRNQPHIPQAMRTQAWQRKQLQTQLASWSELRHDSLLYVKQSYTAGFMCQYPAGYVEPYPELYSRVRLFAEEFARHIAAVDYRVGEGKQDTVLLETQARQVAFFEQMASQLTRLETLATKELSAEPFTADEQAWLKKTIDGRGEGSGPPRYDGWYCDLFYGGGTRATIWDPTIVDVHTDPNLEEVLEVGVGNCNFLVVAVDNEEDRMMFVGPVYSYYEFHTAAGNRLTDGRWQEQLKAGTMPNRPQWTSVFAGPPKKRELK